MKSSPLNCLKIARRCRTHRKIARLVSDPSTVALSPLWLSALHLSPICRSPVCLSIHLLSECIYTLCARRSLFSCLLSVVSFELKLRFAPFALTRLAFVRVLNSPPKRPLRKPINKVRCKQAVYLPYYRNNREVALPFIIKDTFYRWIRYFAYNYEVKVCVKWRS